MSQITTLGLFFAKGMSIWLQVDVQNEWVGESFNVWHWQSQCRSHSGMLCVSVFKKMFRSIDGFVQCHYTIALFPTMGTPWVGQFATPFHNYLCHYITFVTFVNMKRGYFLEDLNTQIVDSIRFLTASLRDWWKS